MIDIHCHILPGLDDGSESMDESLVMAETAVRSGTTAMACSVHSNQWGRYENYESEELKAHFRRLTLALKAEKIPLTLVRGMEIFASPDMVDRIRAGELISLNRSGNYLMEFGFDESPMVMTDRIREMLAAGFQPVVAHPERYYCIQEDPNLVYDWRLMGAYIQINKGSLLGRFGREEQRTSEILLDHQLAHCIASDAHGEQYRTTEMREIARYITRRYSEEICSLLLQVNPSRILMGSKLTAKYPPLSVERSGWYR